MLESGQMGELIAIDHLEIAAGTLESGKRMVENAA